MCEKLPAAKVTLCSICQQPVSLELAKTDEDGQAAHQRAAKVCLRETPQEAP